MWGRVFAPYVTQATLFCSQNSPVNHGNTRKRGNSCIFEKTSGLFKNVEIHDLFGAPQAENSPIRKVAGAGSVDHPSQSFRRSNVTKSPAPSTSQRCGFSARHFGRRSETLEIRWKIKGKHHALLVCRKHHGAFQQSETARRTGAASPCQEHQRAHRHRTRNRTVLTAEECTGSGEKSVHFTVAALILHNMHASHIMQI